jgi:hypothetical protein
MQYMTNTQLPMWLNLANDEGTNPKVPGNRQKMAGFVHSNSKVNRSQFELFKTICKKYKGPEITQSASGNTKIPR